MELFAYAGPESPAAALHECSVLYLPTDIYLFVEIEQTLHNLIGKTKWKNPRASSHIQLSSS